MDYKQKQMKMKPRNNKGINAKNMVKAFGNLIIWRTENNFMMKSVKTYAGNAPNQQKTSQLHQDSPK